VQTTTVFRVSAISLLLGTLVACGGGGSSSSSTSTLSGKVIDGYIRGATVCLDVNSNNRCDAGEPTTTSTAGGAYTLPAYTGSIAGLQVIAEVGPNARDEDDAPGVLIGAGNGYSLLAPAAASSTVTPLSTLVSSAIAAGGGESQVSIGDALSSVSAKFGIPVAALVANDYKANTSAANTATAAVAKATATALSQVTNTLRNNATVQAANLTDGQIIQQAILSVKNKVLPQILSSGQLTPTAAASSTAIVAAVTTAISNADLAANSDPARLAGNIQNIVVASQAGSGSVVNMESVFRSGLVVVQDSSGDYINASGNRVNGSYGGYTNSTDAEFIRYDAAANVDIMKRYVLVGNQWFIPFEGGEGWTFDGTEWVLSLNVTNTASNPNARPVFEQNCVSFPENARSSVFRKYCAVEKKLDGKRMSQFIPGLCRITPGLTLAVNCSTAIFPTGSSAYDLTSTTVSTIPGTYNGLFQLWADKVSFNGYRTSNAQVNPTAGTIFDFIEHTKTNVQYVGGGCSNPFKILSYNTSTKKGQIQWGSQGNGCQNPSPFAVVETSDFEVISAAGKDVFIVPTPAAYRVRNPSSDQPYLIFARQTSSRNISGIWSGAYYPVGFKGSIPFTGDPSTNSQVVSPALFNAVLIQQGITPYPYTGNSSSGTYVWP
jgi:hypothetical protein